MGLDWSVGEYERTATQLEDAAAAVLEIAAVAPGERLLDVACGSGNVAMRAGGSGARITAVDRAGRLVEVGRRRTLFQGVVAGWVTGDALQLPFAQEAFDVVVSVFGVIFVDPAEAAAAELQRVVGPGGRHRGHGACRSA